MSITELKVIYILMITGNWEAERLYILHFNMIFCICPDRELDLVYEFGANDMMVFYEKLHRDKRDHSCPFSYPSPSPHPLIPHQCSHAIINYYPFLYKAVEESLL